MAIIVESMLFQFDPRQTDLCTVFLKSLLWIAVRLENLFRKMGLPNRLRFRAMAFREIIFLKIIPRLIKIGHSRSNSKFYKPNWREVLGSGVLVA